MIAAIQIENFKGIGKEVRVELKPITLLFGENSSGKSTIVQAIHYGREIFERHNLDPDRTVLGGDVLDLGGFENFVHNHDTRRRIRMRFEVDLTCATLPWYRDEDVDESWVEEADVSWAIDATLERCWVEVEVGWLSSLDQFPSQGVVVAYTVGLNGQRIASVSLRPYKELVAPMLRIELNHPLLSGRNLPGTIAELIREEFVRGDHLEVFFSGRTHGLLPSSLPAWGQLIWMEGYRQQEADRDGDCAERWYALRRGLSRMVVGPGELVRNELRKFRYLGPLREMPPRNYEPPRHPDASSWANGLAAWDALHQADQRGEELPNESPEDEPAVAETAEHEWGRNESHPAEGGGVDRLSIEVVNEWLHDRLEAGYAVDRRSRTQVDTQTIPKGNADPKELGRFVEELKKKATKRQVVLVPDGQSIEVRPHDVGTGISQLLPVVVLALDTRRSLVAIEQPELHLHPALQTKLGDLFIESAVGERKNTLLIETHSEHLLLRLLRRIRETTEATPRAHARPLRPDQVSVIYVERTEQGVQLSQLRIDESGEFIDRWPKGFFEERVDEIL